MPNKKTFSSCMTVLTLVAVMQMLNGCQTYKKDLEEKLSRIEKSIEKRNTYILRNTDNIRKSILKQYQGQLLTPENAGDVDLSHLKIGFQYAMTNPINNSKMRYTLIDTTGGLFKFRHGITSTKGVEKESKTYDYLNSTGKTARWVMGKYHDVKFTPPKSLFTIGETTYQLHDTATDKPEKKNTVSVINVAFRDGVWEVIYNTPQLKNYKIEFIFDRNGLPLFEYDKQATFHPLRVRDGLAINLPN